MSFRSEENRVTPEETLGLTFFVWLLDKVGTGNHILTTKSAGNTPLVMEVSVNENKSFEKVDSLQDLSVFARSIGVIFSQPVIGAVTIRSILPSGKNILRGWMCLGGHIIALNEQQLLDAACAGENGKILSPEPNTEYAKAWDYPASFVL